MLVHGGGGHGRLLSALTAPVIEAGFRAVAPDLPGFGLTRVPVGHVPVLADWVALVAALAAEQPGPVSLFGLSLGGTVALHAAMVSEAVDAVLASTLLDLQHRPTLRGISTMPWLVAGLPLVRGPLVRLPVRVRHLAPLARMSSDPQINALLRTDPLIGARWIPLGFFASLASTPPPGPIETFDRVPIQVVHPAADAWTPPALSRRTFDRLPGPKRWVDLPEGGHLPVEPEAVAQLRASVLAFLDGVTGQPM